MIDVTQPVSASFIIATIGVIFGVIAVGIVMVILAKKRLDKTVQEAV